MAPRTATNRTAPSPGSRTPLLPQSKARLRTLLPVGDSDFSITFDRETLAESLWEYGEDVVAQRAMTLDDVALRRVQELAASRYETDPDPARGPRLTNGRIMARAAIEFITGKRRDTVRQRRRTTPRSHGFLT